MNIIRVFRMIFIIGLICALMGLPMEAQAQDIAGTISGTVKDTNGNPIEGVGILISSDNYFDGTCSDGDSNYSFNDLPEDNYNLSASTNSFYCSPATEAANYAQEFWRESPFTNGEEAVSLSVENPTENNVNFTLSPGGSISGKIYDTDGNPITSMSIGIALNLEDYSSPTEIYTCTNSTTGEYELKHIPLNVAYKVAANVFPCGPGNSFAPVNAWPDSPINSGGASLTFTESNPSRSSIDFYLHQLGDTPAGNDVLTFTPNGFITFESVNSAGTTTVEPSDPSPIPPNFEVLGETFYEVSTNATFTSAQVCFFYDDTGLSQEQESAIRLLHKEGFDFVDVTDSGYPDTFDDVVCGTVTSFSPFVVVRMHYDFNGFFQPVDNLPGINLAKAGSTIPVKFSLGDDQGLDIFEADYPRSQTIACDSTAPVDGIEETVAANSSGLTYDAEANQYIYVWKTDKNWSGSCRQLIIKLNDGTLRVANFKFK